jgi:hypothetical protein
MFYNQWVMRSFAIHKLMDIFTSQRLLFGNFLFVHRLQSPGPGARCRLGSAKAHVKSIHQNIVHLRSIIVYRHRLSIPVDQPFVGRHGLMQSEPRLRHLLQLQHPMKGESEDKTALHTEPARLGRPPDCVAGLANSLCFSHYLGL